MINTTEATAFQRNENISRVTYLPHGTLAVTNCPFPVDGGCANANPFSNFKNPTLFSTVLTSGFTTILPTHPMNYNVPAQDYAVGYDTRLTLKDPQSAQLPPGCTYTTGVVLCNNHQSYSFDGWDFTGAISAYGHPISLQFGPNTSGTCSVTNSKFLVDTTNVAIPTWFKNGTCNRIYWYNQCSGSGAAGQLMACIEDDSRSASNSFDARYNAFPNQSFSRLIIATGSGGAGLNWFFGYNYVENLNSISTVNHGELDLYGGQSPGGTGYTVNSKEWSNNFIIWTNPQSPNNATFFAGTGNQNNFKTLATTINSNVIIVNGAGPGHALIDGEWANLGVVNMNNNYIYPVGSFFCGQNGLSVQSDIATVSGNTATVTGPPIGGSPSPVIPEAGYFITGPGMTQANVTSVTGTIPNMVVTFDGPPQNLGSINITVVPGFTSLTANGNVNLTDLSAITFPANNFVGQCNNHR